jgi:DNA-binding NarL/FixJ family response regulator
MGRILIADDHPLFRAALQAAVQRALPDVLTIECESLGAAQAQLRAGPDTLLVLLDLKMPDCEGFAGLLALRSEFPAAPVVVVSATEDAATVQRAMAFGAAGFIPKSTPLSTMGAALRAILDGDSWTPSPDEPRAPAAIEAGIAALTPAQLKILIGLQRGSLNKQIAHDMGVTEATIKAHLTAIFRKLGVHNRTQAVIAAQSLSVEAE